MAYGGEAFFPWAGGRWARDLIDVGGDAQHLVLRSLLTHTTATDGSWLDEGPVVRIGDFLGCTALSADPTHPVSDPATTSLSFTFEPAGPLGGHRLQRHHHRPDLPLCGSGANVELPAGAWFVSGATNTGHVLVFSPSGGSTYVPRLEVFDAPQPESSPLASLDIAYAP